MMQTREKTDTGAALPNTLPAVPLATSSASNAAPTQMSRIGSARPGDGRLSLAPHSHSIVLNGDNALIYHRSIFLNSSSTQRSRVAGKKYRQRRR
jgi:hypothetical protein